jgi:hypothetical protein
MSKSIGILLAYVNHSQGGLSICLRIYCNKCGFPIESFYRTWRVYPEHFQGFSQSCAACGEKIYFGSLDSDLFTKDFNTEFRTFDDLIQSLQDT